MSSSTSPSPERPPHDPQILRQRVKVVGNRLYGLSRRGPGKQIAEPLLQSVEDLRLIWLGLRRLSLVRDLTGVKALLEQEHELRHAVETLKGTLDHLSHTNDKTAAIIDEQSLTLDELEMLDGDEEVVERLRGMTGSFRQAADEMKQGITRSRADVEVSERIVESVDRHLAKAREEAARDGLTQMLSRPAFEECITGLVTQPSSATGRWCVAVAEVDRFAGVGDKHGDHVADALLFRVAEVVRRACASHTDVILARYDDEQFGILFPRYSLRQAYRVAEDVREAVRTAKWECKTTRPPTIVTTSLSVGLTEFRDREAPDHLLARAESCLKRARSAGCDVVAVEG